MKLITKEHNRNDYFFLLGLALSFSVMYTWKGDLIYLMGALIMIGLAIFRKKWLGKRLK
jgi:hypothetical protein